MISAVIIFDNYKIIFNGATFTIFDKTPQNIEVEAVEGTDVSEFHQILVVTAWDKNDVTEFFVKDYWCEEFGPFYTGEDTYIKVDSPNLDTYLVRAYVKEGKNGDWQLVSESWNQEQVYLP